MEDDALSGQPAARIGDMLMCTTPQTTPAALPHAPAGVPISAVGAATVLIGGEPAARMGDFSLCPTPAPVPNAIMRGAFPVPIMNMPAARMTDSGTAPHAGVIMPPCCPTVLIGLSGTTGNPRIGKLACEAAADGRSSKKTRQSYENCGVESSRQIINQANRTAVDEKSLLQNAINNGWADGTPGMPPAAADGGTSAAGRAAILRSAGVNSTVQVNTLENLGLASSRGQGLIANLDPALLWGQGTPGKGHAVAVTGVKYDDAGNVTHVVINDTGTGKCGQEVDVATWNKAVAGKVGGSSLNVTNTPIW
jgi:uncharacterized Zn-binding protein involved in type VI secretion